MATPAHDDSPLRQARLAQAKRLRDVAEEAGCSTGLVSMVERGGPASERVRQRMAQAVGASLGSFWPERNGAGQ